LDQILHPTETLKAILENALDGILIADSQTKAFYYCNPAICRMLGYEREELLAMKVQDIHPAEELSKVLEQFRKLASKELLLSEEISVRKKDGGVLFAEVNGFPVEINGKPCLVGFFRDTTERRRMTREMRLQNALLKAEQEASMDGILVVDKSGRMVSFNHRFIDMWDIPPDVVASRSDELALKSVMDKLQAPQEFMDRVQNLYAHPDDVSYEQINLRDGRCFERYSSPVLGPEGQYYGRVWYFRDITRRK